MRAPVALVALALLAAGGSSQPHHNCSLLANHTSANAAKWGWRSVSQQGVESSVTLVWGSEPARAAAAVLAALLRHVRLYRGVRLSRAPSPLDLAALATSVPVDMTGRYTDLLIGVSTAWEPVPRAWEPARGPWAGLAGPRLQELGASGVAARRRLHARLAPRARARRACRAHRRWPFYANRTALIHCDFVNATSPQESTVDVLAVGECNATLQRLQQRASAANTPLNVRTVNRAEFLHMLHTANHSFLFLDFDMWQEAANVRTVDPPPCVSVDPDCKQELDSAIAMRVADVDILQTYAPQLFQFVHDFNPTPETLRRILERQASGVDIEEAACEWVLNTSSDFIRKTDKLKYDIYNYNVGAYLCYGDENNEQYDAIIDSVARLLYETYKDRCNIVLKRYYSNCSDDNDLSVRLNSHTQNSDFYKLVGIVSMAGTGAAKAEARAVAAQLPLLWASEVPRGEGGGAARGGGGAWREAGGAWRVAGGAWRVAGGAWRVAGGAQHAARALLRFVRASGWTRLAVLSQHTELAADYYAALEDIAEITLREFPLPFPLTEDRVQGVLKDLRDTNARIVFINADIPATIKIMTAAVPRGMGYSDGFVWIAREWYPEETVRQNKVLNGTKHFTVSFWFRGFDDLPHAEGWEPVRDKLKNTSPLNQPWPPHAASLVDALLTISMGIRDVFQRYPDSRHDLHRSGMIQLLEESLMGTPVAGVSQRLRYAERSIEEASVFVDEWCGGRFERRLASWRVNATSGSVRGSRADLPRGLPRDDGRPRCAVRSGEPFAPACHDAEVACAAVLLALAPAAALLARRALRRRLARAARRQQLRALARRRRVAAVLAAHLVRRAALQLRDELGAGRFGSVRRARLARPGRAPRYVAAKALRPDAAPSEESEFLREACIIASLNHPHVVRLVGVCVDGPPLVLMELAFFGDLLRYLRERRHLVEGAAPEDAMEGAAPEDGAASGEAQHVSAEALTRLAREAAEALHYLSVCGVVHRDVRAANCLVDAKRSLKLADFGLAREAATGADGGPEYACHRRGLFPVLWMAPESLAHGVFSSASDVWALGVLVLELVTLGARPYGSMSLLRVMRFVKAGGTPLLPRDATPQTRGLARQCWARAGGRRPGAAQVARYLRDNPRALCPALLAQCHEHADADSGFGESPSIKLLPPDSPPDSPLDSHLDSPLDSFERLHDLAATH